MDTSRDIEGASRAPRYFRNPSSMRKCNTWRNSLMAGTLGGYGKKYRHISLEERDRKVGVDRRILAVRPEILTYPR
ncbi:MAG: hypothetical protein Q8O04_02995 [Deltaproteobacteria bacterium]|nr:hypothetical protein [Deltaproteobacteria bacterium]